MALTAIEVKAAKPTDKPFKLSDGGGLYLLVQPNGAKYWRLDYRFSGKRKTLAVGVYPDVSLLDARERRDEARKLLAADIDPSANKKAKRAAKQGQAANSFEVVALEWLEKFGAKKAASTIEKTHFILRRDVFPWLGVLPIAEIKPFDLLTALQRIEGRGALETAHRAKQYVGQIFRYAVGTQRAERDISQDLKGALPAPNVKHRAAITDPLKFGGLLRAIDAFAGTFTVKCAMKLAPLIFVRPGELRRTEWAWVDLDAAMICYPAAVMKMREDHIVPLSRQAVEILHEIQPLTGQGRYVFPGIRTGEQPMSEAAINAALRRLGFDKTEMTGHGFRATVRTIGDEVLGFRVDLIEHQLAHAVKDPNGRAYNRTAHLPERKKMMQQWADYLDKLKAGAEVIQLHGNVA
ncbi:tyrosine-type recombinase/integrase [Sulfuricella sp.]|uniref:tyrosine-type recombinase/integrase n=1 Tax=Sulfuricella sp. TaxID=2099377 RepID=UPI002B5A1608|nr:integrase arm-type DNA-binding domain-containing protein [Sulfuricella sp.]HUX64299.1 integrase arm-type DNA-binding domain-containing protein [Sulfuricella sp.]